MQTLLPLPCVYVFEVVLSGPSPLVVVTVVTLFAGCKELSCLESTIRTVAILFELLQLQFIFAKLESLLFPHILQFVYSPIIFPYLLINLHITHVKNAITYAKKLYNIAYMSKVPLGAITNVTIKYMAKNVAPTSKGQLNIFCNTIANIIVATGKAKKINKTFIFFL